MVKEMEYRNFGKNDKGVYKIGYCIKDTDVCLMHYDGYIVGRNADVMRLYPSRRGEGTMGIIKIPMKHSISIFLIKNGGMKNEGNYM